MTSLLVAPTSLIEERSTPMDGEADDRQMPSACPEFKGSPALLTPEQLAKESTEGYFLLALDHTGARELTPPAGLAAQFVSWSDSGLVEPGTDDPLHAIATDSQTLVVNAFLNAMRMGFGACVATLDSGIRVMLSFWNRLDAHDMVLVIASVSGLDPSFAAPTVERTKPLRCVQHVNVFGITEYIDDATTEILGWGPEVVGRPRLDYQHPDDFEEGMASWARLLATPDQYMAARARMLDSDGNWRWFDSRSINRLHSAGHVEIEMIDIDEHVHAQPTTVIPVSVGDAIAEQSSTGIIVVDATLHVVACNDRFCELSGAVIDRETRRLIVEPSPAAAELAIELQRLLNTDDEEPRQWGDAPRFTASLVHRSATQRHVMVTAEADLPATAPLPKGLSAPTMVLIMEALQRSDHPDGASYNELAALAGVSEVTVRRYLSHLRSEGAVEDRLDYGVPGRPRRRFVLS